MINPPISMTDAQTKKRIRLSALPVGTALVSGGNAEPILGYCYYEGCLVVYVKGSTPPAFRAAQQEGYTAEETWLVGTLPMGMREIDLTDCRQTYSVQLPEQVKTG
jgi:hypothetical protein